MYYITLVKNTGIIMFLRRSMKINDHGCTAHTLRLLPQVVHFTSLEDKLQNATDSLPECVAITLVSHSFLRSAT